MSKHLLDWNRRTMELKIDNHKLKDILVIIDIAGV